MGVIIYTNGELDPGRELSEEEKRGILSINDGWQYPAFKIEHDDIITFDSDQMEGVDPYTDGVMKPLEALIEYAKKTGIRLSGSIYISSDWQDFDNILIDVTDNTVKQKNYTIANASTDELLEELKERNVFVQPGSREMTKSQAPLEAEESLGKNDLPSWLFIGAYPGGDLYADKRAPAGSDYKHLALVNEYGILWYPDGIFTDASVRELIFENAEAKKQEFIDKIDSYSALPAADSRDRALHREYDTLLNMLPANEYIKLTKMLAGSELSLKERVMKTYETLRSLSQEQNDRYVSSKLHEREETKKKKSTKTKTR